MPVEAGGDHSWLRPVPPSMPGHMPAQAGTHRGTSEIFNVLNPQPGWHYWWGIYGSPEMIRRQYEGYHCTPLDTPEGRAMSQVQIRDDRYASAQTQYVMRGRMVLMRIPMQRYHEIRAAKRQTYIHKLEGVTTYFEDQGRQMAQALGHRKAEPIYFRRSDHDFGQELTPLPDAQ